MQGSINQQVKILREQHLRLSQREFAAALGCTQGNITNIERAQDGRGVTTDMITKLAEVYNVNTEWLIKGVGQPFVSDDSQPGQPLTLLRNSNGFTHVPLDKSDPRYASYLEDELKKKEKELTELKEDYKELQDTLRYIKRQSTQSGKTKLFGLESWVEETEIELKN